MILTDVEPVGSGGSPPVNNWLIRILDSVFASKPKDPAPVITKPLCTPDPAVLLACKIAQHYEGLFLKPYLDPAGIPTIGWGSTYYENGTRVTMQDPEITEARAKILLYTKMEGFVSIVDQYVDVPLNVSDTASLADLVYNIGPTEFEGSTLLHLLNTGSRTGAEEQFPLWDRGGGQVLTGLEERRKTEQTLFETGNLVFYTPNQV